VALAALLLAQGGFATVLSKVTFWAVALLFFLYGAKLLHAMLLSSSFGVLPLLRNNLPTLVERITLSRRPGSQDLTDGDFRSPKPMKKRHIQADAIGVIFAVDASRFLHCKPLAHAPCRNVQVPRAGRKNIAPTPSRGSTGIKDSGHDEAIMTEMAASHIQDSGAIAV